MEGKNESKHTPGEWIYNEKHHVIEDSEGHCIARTANDVGFPMPNKANSLLISRAPALLEENERLKHENYYDDQVHKIEVDRLMKELSESKSLVSDHWEVINGLIKEKTELMGALKSLHDLSEEYMSDSELWAPFIEQAKSLLTRIK